VGQELRLVTTDYTLNIKNLAGASVATDIPVETLSFSENLNAPGSCTFRVPLYASYALPANFAVGQTTFELMRSASLQAAGYIWSTSVDVGGQTVDVTGAGWYSRFRRRLIIDTVAYQGVEQFDMAWNLINHIQNDGANADMGITRSGSETPSGISRKRIWCCYEGTALSDALEELAFDYQGFDFEITPAKVWKVYYPTKGGTSGTSLTTGSGVADTSNIYTMTYSEDASGLTTRAYVVPDTDYCNDIADFASSNIATYGLMQASMNAATKVKQSDERTTEAKEYVHQWRTPRWQLSVQTDVLPFGGNYGTGDTVSVTSNAGYATWAARAFRVLAWQVDVAEGVELATLTLDSIMDSTT
jgi:hypothetical protein